MKRSAGILLHVSSLPSSFGIGDIGLSAYQFIDFLSQARQRYWQILPLNPIDGAYGYSPYSSPSAFAANTWLISPEELAKEGLLTENDFEHNLSFSKDQVDYEQAKALKSKLLGIAFQRFEKNKKWQGALEGFLKANQYWLDDYALFSLIKKLRNGEMWHQWPKNLRDRDAVALAELKKDHRQEYARIRWEQFIFFHQWNKLKDYCHQKDIEIIGDVPIYVNFDSADVWAHPHLFKLLFDKSPEFVAGVPPDYFSKTGQRWGNPVYNWPVHQKEHFHWWLSRFKLNFHLYDTVRIDHFRGLVQYWEIPAEEETAVKGTWQDVPTEEFIQTIVKAFPGHEIIAEDLGIITPDVTRMMEKFNLPGMKILLFAFGGDLQTHIYLPHNCPPNSVIYTGTHDNNTVKGWWCCDASAHEKQNVCRYLKKDVQENDVHWEFVQLAYNAPSHLAIIPLQDGLGLDEKARMNTPGTTKGNWLWRCQLSNFSKILSKELAELVVSSGRL